MNRGCVPVLWVALAIFVFAMLRIIPGLPYATAAPRERILTRIVRPTPEPNTIIRWESPCKGAVLHLQPRLFVWVCPNGEAYSARYDR